MQRLATKRAGEPTSLSPGASGDVADFVHDLRQCVAVLGAVTATLRAKTRGDAALTRSIEIAEEQVRAMASLCDAMTGDQPASRLVDLQRIVEHVAGATTHSSGTRIEVHTEPVAVWGTELDWHRIVANVVDNAVRAAGDGGAVQIMLRRGESEAIVEVADDGPGFGASPRGRSGRGLSIVSRLLHDWRGACEIEPREPRGTLVRLRVPAQIKLASSAPVEAGSFIATAG